MQTPEILVIVWSQSTPLSEYNSSQFLFLFYTGKFRNCFKSHRPYNQTSVVFFKQPVGLAFGIVLHYEIFWFLWRFFSLFHLCCITRGIQRAGTEAEWLLFVKIVQKGATALKALLIVVTSSHWVYWELQNSFRFLTIKSTLCYKPCMWWPFILCIKSCTHKMTTQHIGGSSVAYENVSTCRSEIMTNIIFSVDYESLL